MRQVPTRIPGPVLVEPSVFGDERGFFVETRAHARVPLISMSHVLVSPGAMRWVLSVIGNVSPLSAALVSHSSVALSHVSHAAIPPRPSRSVTGERIGSATRT